MERAGRKCEVCGRSEADAHAAGTWLEAHHKDGRGVSADEHDLDQIVVLCRTPCHARTLTSERTRRKRASLAFPWRVEAEAEADGLLDVI